VLQGAISLPCALPPVERFEAADQVLYKLDQLKAMVFVKEAWASCRQHQRFDHQQVLASNENSITSIQGP